MIDNIKNFYKKVLDSDVELYNAVLYKSDPKCLLLPNDIDDIILVVVRFKNKNDVDIVSLNLPNITAVY